MSEEKTNDDEVKTNDEETTKLWTVDEEKLWEQLRPTLWQYIEKEHMEGMMDDEDYQDEEGNQLPISEEEWELFIRYFQNAFGNEVSCLALEYWNDRHYNGMPKVETKGEEE